MSSIGVVLAAAILPPAVCVIALRFRPHVLLATYAFFVPFGSAFALPIGPKPFNTVSSAVGLVVTFGLAVQLVATRRSIPRLPSSVYAWLILFGWLILTLLWSVEPSESLDTLPVSLSLLGLFLVAVLSPIDRDGLRTIEVAVVAGAMGLAARALFLAATGRLHETASRIPRFTFEEGDPNITAATLLLAFVLAMWWSLQGPGVAQRRWASATSLTLLATIMIAGSRGALVSVVAATLIVLLHCRGLPARRLVGYGLGALSVVVVALSFLPEELTSRLRETHSTGRTAIWRLAFDACPEVCMTGSGWSTFSQVYRQQYLESPTLPAMGYNKAYGGHNVYLSMLVDGGLVGFLLFTAALGLLVHGLLRLPRGIRGAPLAALIALLTSNFFLSNFNFKYFWLTLTYATIHLVIYQRRSDSPAPEHDPSIEDPPYWAEPVRASENSGLSSARRRWT